MGITAEAWLKTRARVVDRYADKAIYVAATMRARQPLFPGREQAMDDYADRMDRYAAECRAVAEDPTLPLPTAPEWKES